MSERVATNHRLPKDLLQQLDELAEELSTPDRKVTRTDLLIEGARMRVAQGARPVPAKKPARAARPVGSPAQLRQGGKPITKGK